MGYRVKLASNFDKQVLVVGKPGRVHDEARNAFVNNDTEMTRDHQAIGDGSSRTGFFQLAHSNVPKRILLVFQLACNKIPKRMMLVFEMFLSSSLIRCRKHSSMFRVWKALLLMRVILPRFLQNAISCLPRSLLGWSQIRCVDVVANFACRSIYRFDIEWMSICRTDCYVRMGE